MFSLKEGNLADNYRKEFIKELCLVDDSKYIFNADVMHVYEDSSYISLTEEQLKEAISKDLDSFESYLTVNSILNLNNTSGWPMIKVKNVKPMTLKEFLEVINTIYYDEDTNYIINDLLDTISVIKEV